MAEPLAQIIAQDVSVAADVAIAKSAQIRAYSVRIEEGAVIGEGVRLRAGSVHLGRGTQICADTSAFFVDSLEIGPFGFVDRECSLRGRSLRAGAHFYVGERVTTGGGGAMGPRARLVAEDAVSIFSETYVNLADHVTLGAGTALSSHVAILTHGCWQSVLEGYPSAFAPVNVGRDVVVYFGSTVLPGCHIGDGTLVGANSLVNQPLPSGCLAAGNPVRIIRENYPQKPSAARLQSIALEVLQMYAEGLDYKGFENVHAADLDQERELSFHYAGRPYRLVLDYAEAPQDEGTILIALSTSNPSVFPKNTRGPVAYFDLLSPSMSGHTDDVVEDVRDFLRRTGVRIMVDRPFRAIGPRALRDLPAFS